MRHLILIATIAALALAAAPALAGKGGNGSGSGSRDAACSVAGNVVTGSGLPNWTLMNFMVTDSEGTSGWVIGFTDDGSRSIGVPDRNGATTYEFTGETRGKDGTRYDVYASCNAS